MKKQNEYLWVLYDGRRIVSQGSTSNALMAAFTADETALAEAERAHPVAFSHGNAKDRDAMTLGYEIRIWGPRGGNIEYLTTCGDTRTVKVRTAGSSSGNRRRRRA